MGTARIGCWLVAAAVAAITSTAAAQPLCAGDCDGSRTVTVSEVLRCVGMALDPAAPATCAACDADSDDRVAVAELVAAVGHALGGCPTRATPTAVDAPTRTPVETPTATPLGGGCGNGRLDVDGETCDDGNLFGGDGCAANCTREQRRTASFDRARTRAGVQSEALLIPLENLPGTLMLTTGAPRATAVFAADGRRLFEAGEIPVVIGAGDLALAPIRIPGTRCACVRALPAEEFGPGNAASGVIGCGAAPLSDVDTLTERDHDTTPGSRRNSGSAHGLPDDPECDDCASFDAAQSCACREGRDADCAPRHGGSCISPRVVTRSGGPSVPGAARLVLKMAIGLLEDTGICFTTRPQRNGACAYPDYGPDCLPCTGDDATFGVPSLVVITTGFNDAAVFDTNGSAGPRIAAGSVCFGPPCQTSAQGVAFSCAALAADASGGLAGGILTVCFPSVDTDPLADTVTCATLAIEAAAAE